MIDESTTAGLDELRRLFQTELGALRFPDVDGDVLEHAAVEVKKAAMEVERCEAALVASRQALLEAEEDELLRAQRALAYARVYAEDRPELHARLHAITLPSLPSSRAPVRDQELSAAPRRRGRPPKARAAGTAPLFGTAATSTEAPIAVLTPTAPNPSPLKLVPASEVDQHVSS